MTKSVQIARTKYREQSVNLLPVPSKTILAECNFSLFDGHFLG